MLEKVEVGNSYELADNIKLGTKVIYTGQKQLRRCKTEIIGIDLTSFSAGIPLVMVKHPQGVKVSESNILNDNASGLQVVYYRDCKFVWADLQEITFMEEDKNE